MYQKTVEKEGYSKKEIIKMRKALKSGIHAYRKDPEFRKALKAFIKETT